MGRYHGPFETALPVQRLSPSPSYLNIVGRTTCFRVRQRRGKHSRDHGIFECFGVVQGRKSHIEDEVAFFGSRTHIKSWMLSFELWEGEV
jgi:hypothetical protein